jgi:hypothetical protein
MGNMQLWEAMAQSEASAGRTQKQQLLREKRCYYLRARQKSKPVIFLF